MWKLFSLRRTPTPLVLLTATLPPSFLPTLFEEFKHPFKIIRKGSNRPNLFYSCKIIKIPSSTEPSNINNTSFEALYQQLISIIRKMFFGSPTTTFSDRFIIYCALKEDVRAVVCSLQQSRINCDSFYGSMEENEKISVLTRWKSGETKLIVATKAFGMGGRLRWC